MGAITSDQSTMTMAMVTMTMRTMREMMLVMVVLVVTEAVGKRPNCGCNPSERSHIASQDHALLLGRGKTGRRMVPFAVSFIVDYSKIG